MNEMAGGDAQDSRDDSEPTESSGGLHDVAGVQRYAAELARMCTAISEDKDLAQKVIDAVHSGNGVSVQELFKEAGVDSRVAVEKREGKAPVDFGGGGEFAAASEEHTHVHVDIGIGPVHVVVDVDK